MNVITLRFEFYKNVCEELGLYSWCYHHVLSQVSFPLVLLLLNQWCTPPLRFQVSYSSIFLIMCNVPSKAVFFVQNLLVLLIDTF
jgi:hypothetical protein